MTLIVIHEDSVYVDSFGTFGPDAHSVNKIRTMPHVDGSLITWTCAGAPAGGQALVELLAQHPENAWCELDLSRHHDPDDHTIVVLRTGAGPGEGAIRIAYLSESSPTIALAPPLTADGLRGVYGSAWTWFLAYYREHGDVDVALHLTAKHHRDVSTPFGHF